MNLVLKDCNRSLSMVNESMNSQSCMSDNWANSYDEFLGGWTLQGVSFVFFDMNPYVRHQNPLKEGQELFRKGLLSEAVLALEAEVTKNPENAEGWRLLGITHDENDDDQQNFY
ncbi:Peroxisome biogenesis 5 -like protein [Gossypium arboreum]|uniref:Peroxisome biogenesis 5-like protein n=1 Tax=Gossypium arboreum TaxID=29729 RepID=A0A0B0NEC7_GOSAR|nr:Peroxisome biogenesis 5 -like protein [Gossypium arboreum]